MQKLLKPLAFGYIGLANVGAAGLFWYDKQQAVQRKWRVPEKTLHATALLGGWLGGIWAMHQFRHKTSKTSFYSVYYTCAAVNGVVLLSLIGKTNRDYALRILQNVLRQNGQRLRF